MHPRTRRIRLGLSLASELTAMRARNYTCEENRTILAGWLVTGSYFVSTVRLVLRSVELAFASRRTESFRFPDSFRETRILARVGSMGNLIPCQSPPFCRHEFLSFREFARPRLCVLEFSSSNVPALRFGESGLRSVRIS
jgi:hypothetical protein